MLSSSRARGLEPRLHVGPVHDLPDGLDIVRSHVLVLKVVRVLPGVDAKERSSALQRVLVRHGLDIQLVGLLVVPQPAPAAALKPDRGLGQGSLELLQRTKVLVDLGQEGALGGPVVLLRAKVLPKDGVIDVAAAVEGDGLRQPRHGLHVSFRLCGLHLLARGVQAVHVSLVVLRVVEFHDLAADDGLKRAVVVRQVWKRMLAPAPHSRRREGRTGGGQGHGHAQHLADGPRSGDDRCHNCRPSRWDR
mmetsp:Transcript_168/g.561  ORF Transcript_168/g.561 Transcript_168/m.561 type:complete len:248 (+) Transcript_168:1387-2130(+)